MTPLENRSSRGGKGIVMVAVRDAQDMGPLLRIGCALARARDTGVRVVTVTTSGSPPSWLSIPEICEDLPVETIVREGRDVARVILDEVQKTEVHTLILGWGGEVSRGRYRLGRTLDPIIQGAPSEVLLVRSQGLKELDRLLIPLAGGPNAPRALRLARAIAPDAEITALYVAVERLGEAEVLVGEEWLETILAGLEASTGIEPRVVQASDPVAGILQEAKEGYDLILLGAGGEDFIDRFLFGDVVQGVLAGTTAPTAVVRRSLSSLGTLQRRIWMRIFRSGPTLTTQQQATVYKNIRRGARPSTDFWVMIALASAIAALGLLLSSPAIIIGAMLIAPLMTVILGMGLSIVLGDPKFFWQALSTTVGGSVLAILVGTLVTLAVPGAQATPEVLSRVNPTLLDLAVALAAGAAAGYAISRRDVSAALAGVAIAAALAPPLTVVGIGLALRSLQIAGGAFLLFLTNIVAIVAAGGLVFLWLGFHPQPGDLSRSVVLRRGFWSIIVLLLLVSIPLGVLTLSSSREARLEREISAALDAELRSIPGVDLVSWSLVEERNGDTLELDVTIRVERSLGYQDARDLQERVARQLDRPVALSLITVPTTRLQAFVPPTPTPTPVPTRTGAPTETPTPTPTTTPTSTPRPTQTPTPTNTPTVTPTPTPTPWLLQVDEVGAAGLRVRYSPGGVILDRLPAGTVVRVLEGPVPVDGERWYWVFVPEQYLEGWVAAEFLSPVAP